MKTPQYKRAYKLLKYFEGKLYSFNPPLGSLCSLRYPENTVIKPVIGRLFVFKDLEDAAAFHDEMKPNAQEALCIYLVEVKDLKRQNYISKGNDDDIKAFWENYDNRHRGFHDEAPYGSYSCSELKLIKRIE